MTSKVESIHQVQGIDTVLTTLPKAIAAILGVISSSDSQGIEESGAVIESEQMMCPRCGLHVQGKHGICK